MAFFCLCAGVLGSCREQKAPQLAVPAIGEVESKTAPLLRFEKSYGMMGTRFSVVLYAADSKKAEKLMEDAFNKAAEINKVCSDYKATSELAQLNTKAHGEIIKLSPILCDVFSQAEPFVILSNGVFDPTAGVQSFAWRLARLDRKLPTAEKVAELKQRVGWGLLGFDKEKCQVLKQKSGMRVDLGGVAKGYAADKMAEMLMAAGIEQFSIAAGGDLRLGAAPPGKGGWVVGIKNLDDKGMVSEKTIELSNCAVSTSGDLHQFIEIDGVRYSHIIDPSTGLGMTDRVSATVIAPNGTMSDMYATGACIDLGVAKKVADVKNVSVLRVELTNGSLKAFKSGIFEAASPL